MNVTFGDFLSSSIIENEDWLVGYDTATAGGERRWKVSTLLQAVTSSENQAKWDSTYTTVYSNSGSWGTGSSTDSQTISFDELTKGLSISNGNTVSLSALVDSVTDTAIRDLTANWENTYTSYRDISSTFLTSETDSQALSFDELTKGLSISNGNTVSLSALVDSTTDTAVRNLTANWQNTYTNVLANSASWALDSTTDTAVRDLTANWENTYTNVLANSASWALDSTTDTAVRALTANWQNTYTNVWSKSANWEAAFGSAGADLAVRALTANWQNTYTNVLANSASWALDSTTDTAVRALTANWQNTYSNVLANSASWALDSTTDTAVRSLTANWQNTYTNVLANSATWASTADTAVRALTANWQNTYTNVLANSATWASTADTAVRALTANWQNTYSNVLANSGSWSSGGQDTGVRNITGSFILDDFIVTCSDEFSPLAPLTSAVQFRMPYAMSLSSVRASVNVGPEGSVLIVDVNRNGTTILASRITIDQSEKTSVTAASAHVLVNGGITLNDDDPISIDIDQVGSTVAGTGLKVTFKGRRL